MKVRKVVTGSVLAAGLGVAGMMGAGTASALGFSVDPAGADNTVTMGSGAEADVGDDNNGLAVSIFRDSTVTANQESTGNFLVGIDGDVDVDGASSSGNTVLSVGGDTSLAGNNDNNVVVALGSNASTGGNTAGQFSLSACGTEFSGQAAKVTVSPGACG